MGKTLLILRLEGPMQSWGLRSRWDARDCGEEPSKSGIVGLLGAALGCSRGDPRLEALDAALRLGVRVERPGMRMVDYHTVSGVLPTAEGGFRGTCDDPTTVLSPREYLQDAAFLAVLDGPDELLQECADALCQPVWPVFLGRKSCPPTRPVLDVLTDRYQDIDDALRSCPWQDGLETQPAPGKRVSLRCYVEDAAGEMMRPDRIRTNSTRMYGRRAVRSFSLEVPADRPRDFQEGGEE